MARGPRSLLVVAASVGRAREAIQVVRATAVKGHRRVLAECSSHWADRWRR